MLPLKKSIKQSTMCQNKAVTKEKDHTVPLEKALVKSALSCVDYHFVSVKLIMPALNES